MRYLLICIIALAVWGCATAPGNFNVTPVATIPGDFDAVWEAVIEYFAVANLPIATIEKESGLIVTDWMDASGRWGGAEDKSLCDCGGSGFFTQHWTRGKFSVFVKRTDTGAVDMRVTGSFQQRRSLADTYSIVNCNSTGYLERQVHGYVAAKVQGTDTPQVPTFRPGTSD